MSKSRFSRLLPKFLRGDKSSKNVSSTDYVDSKLPKCFIHFLDDSQHQLPFKGSWKGCQLLEKVYDMLNLHEKDYFSLRFIDSSGQTHWLDGNKTLSSQFKGCFNPYKLYFGVKFYAADPCKLREEITRYLFFLQVKQDILQGRLPVTFDEAAELCAYAVQSELGDFDPRHHTPGYVSEFCFVPNQSEELERKIAAIHRRLGGLVPMMAEYRFLDKVKWLDMYGVDLHPVMGEGSVEYFLGLTPTGIVVYKNKNKVGNYFWPRINKVTFRGKIFIIKVKDKNNEEHAYAFELPRKAACKYVWKCCVEHHAFFRLNQTQERSFRQVRITRSFSANHGSGRTQRQAFSDNLSRQSSAVVRLPSRRQPRRVSSDSRLNAHGQYESQYHKDSGMVTMVIRPEPVRGPRHRSLPELQGHESPRSTKSAPWEGKLDYGLYTGGRESPVSAPSDRMNQQRNRGVSGSDSESGISQRRKYFPNRRGSDNDSDASMSRRRRREIDSDSGSDVSSRYHTTRSNNEKSTKTSFPVLYPFHDKDSKQNGSVPSLHSAPAGETRQRRRRRRSKSPGKKPPEELRRHFEYDLKDTEGMSQEQLREIPFVNVETKSSFFKLKYSPKLRQKVKASKQKNSEVLDQNRNEILHRQTSAPSTDTCDKSSVRQSQHTDTDAGDGLGNRQQMGAEHSMVGRSRSFTRRPYSYHQSQSHTLPNNISSSSTLTATHHGSSHITEEKTHDFITSEKHHLYNASLADSEYQISKSSPYHSPYQNSEPRYPSSRPKYSASVSSYQSHRSYHRDRSSLFHPTHSQNAYESDNNMVLRSRQHHHNTRNRNTYEPVSQSQSRPKREGDLEGSQRYSSSRQEGGSRLFNPLAQSPTTTLDSYGKEPHRRNVTPSRTDHSITQSQPYDMTVTSSYTRDSSFNSYPNPHTQQRHVQQSSQAVQREAASPTSSSVYGAHTLPGERYSYTSSSYAQGQRSRPHGLESNQGSKLFDDNRSTTVSPLPSGSEASRYPSSRLITQQQGTDNPLRYRQEPQSRYQSPQQQPMSTPPRYQSTPPRYGTSPQNLGTSDQYSDSSKYQSTPPRSQKDPNSSYSYFSPHSREQAERRTGHNSAGSSKYNSRSSYPSPSDVASDRPGSRTAGGSSMRSDVAFQLLKSPGYNPNLCTEL